VTVVDFVTNLQSLKNLLLRLKTSVLKFAMSVGRWTIHSFNLVCIRLMTLKQFVNPEETIVIISQAMMLMGFLAAVVGKFSGVLTR
jgi:hypothetical protein